jgi:hypothetical protein
MLLIYNFETKFTENRKIEIRKLFHAGMLQNSAYLRNNPRALVFTFTHLNTLYAIVEATSNYFFNLHSPSGAGPV